MKSMILIKHAVNGLCQKMLSASLNKIFPSFLSEDLLIAFGPSSNINYPVIGRLQDLKEEIAMAIIVSYSAVPFH